MAFHLGSLGFLTPFEFDNFQEQVTNVLEGEPSIYLFIVRFSFIIKLINFSHLDTRPCGFNFEESSKMCHCA